MQSAGFEQKFMKFIDSSNVWCLDLYLMKIFMESAKAERCTGIMFKLTLYCLSVIVEDLNLNEDINISGTCYFILLAATFGAGTRHKSAPNFSWPAYLGRKYLNKIEKEILWSPILWNLHHYNHRSLSYVHKKVI